jgi:acetyl esterase/lipase
MTSLPRIGLDVLRSGRTVRYADHRLGVAELHLPAGPGPHPVVVLIHGGSWRDGFDRRVMRPLAHDLRRRGFAAWNVGYRRLGRSGGGWPMTFVDVAEAIDALADVDAPLDLDRVALLGHSAGGHLALWAAGREDLPAGAPGAGPVVRPSVVIGMAAVTDLERLGGLTTEGGLIHRLLGGGPEDVPERYALVSPIRRVPVPMPALLVHGTDDRVVGVGQSRRYAAAATAAGGEAELVEVHAIHRDHVDPRSAAWTAVAERLPGLLPARAPGYAASP